MNHFAPYYGADRDLYSALPRRMLEFANKEERAVGEVRGPRLMINSTQAISSESAGIIVADRPGLMLGSNLLDIKEVFTIEELAGVTVPSPLAQAS